MNRPPRVSVILAAYRSEATVAGCLAALRRQSLRDFEVIVVDSSPDGATAAAVAAFPEVRLERSAVRLGPHAARNRGASLARGELLVFSDPDVYADPSWLERLVAAAGERVLIAGALACHGGGWLDRGIHLCKFSKWLPGGAPHLLDCAASANLLCPRQVFEEIGGFPPDLWHGDALFTWKAAQAGVPTVFAPDAVVAHDHRTPLAAFISERASRGVLFGKMRIAWSGHGRAACLGLLAASVLPVRFARILWLTSRHCGRSGSRADLLVTLPVVVAGHLASLAGESLAYAAGVIRPARPPAR